LGPPWNKLDLPALLDLRALQMDLPTLLFLRDQIARRALCCNATTLQRWMAEH